MLKVTEETILFINKHAAYDIRKLALQANSYPQIDMPFALRQIAGRQQAKHKIPFWYNNPAIVYPRHLSLEQCSSEQTARYKANLCEGTSLVDLTGGLGIDFFFMARNMLQSTYVEQQSELVELAKHNFEVLNLHNATVIEENAVHYLETMQAVDTIYIDPARRNTFGKKTVKIEDCTPNLIEIEPLLEQKSKRSIIKLSPMLDISMALKTLTSISCIHIVSCDNECKELLFVKDKQTFASTLMCVNLPNNGEIQTFSFTKEQEELANPTYTSSLQTYLYEPNASILKAGGYRYLAKYFELEKLNKNSHLYTSNSYIEEFPGRKFEIKEVIPFRKKELKTRLKKIYKANITVRNFPISVDEIRKRTGLKEGGEDYLFATTLLDEQKVLVVCKKMKN